jgi:hypothetical protein
VEVVDSAAFFLVHLAYFGVVGFLTWRERRRDATGLRSESPRVEDVATRRLLSHPAPEGMLTTIGGKLATMDPEAARKRAVVLGPHLKAAAVRAARETK